MKLTIGDYKINRYGSKFEIIDIINETIIKIKFDNGYICETSNYSFNHASCKSPYCKTLLGYGYTGDGDYKPTKNNVFTIQYRCWTDLLKRVYSSRYQDKKPTYKGCVLCEEWHNFQNFAKWYDENYYSVGDERMCLDKDILVKGNKVYSPETCIFVPITINSLMVLKKNNGGELPVGVGINGSKYSSRCRDSYGVKKHLGNYNTKEEAFETYKLFKENIIKHYADTYMGLIPDILYNTLYDYKVGLTG